MERIGIHKLAFDVGKTTEESGIEGGDSAEVYKDSALGISYKVKAEGEHFYFYENGDWKEKFITGVNIGATEPGLFPGDLTISYDSYYRWFGYISEMNCNSIRVYTLMRPQFYTALHDFNKKAENPIYLFQGVWLNEEDIASISDAYAENQKILEDFKNDCLTLVNVIHGNASVPESPGKASGKYVADVSTYMAGWIIGIEWDPNFVLNTNNQNPEKTEHVGRYMFTQSASPFEAFLCTVGDAMIEYETERYNFQIPLAFANWITTDPLTHPNEPHYDEDKVTVNVENIKTRSFLPGQFASYHVYPYYPDSLNYQTDYLQYVDEYGKQNTYRAYLDDLKLAHNMPILVAEFGVPTSRGMGHESVMGYNQGRIDEIYQGAMLKDMFQSIYDADYAGGLVFTWQDEWFKRTWNNVMFDIADNRAFWSNIQTTEQNFGLLAFDPGAITVEVQVDGNISEWAVTEPIVENESGKLYVKSDERYLYLLVKCPESYSFTRDTLYIPINTISGQGNDHILGRDVSFDIGADFLISINGSDNSHIYVDNYYDAFYYHFIKGGLLADYHTDELKEQKNTGIFSEMLMCYGYNLVVGVTGQIVGDKTYETGKLQFGDSNPLDANYTSLTDFVYLDGNLEIRIPWQLLNVMDPSTKQQIGDFNTLQSIENETYDEFDFGLGIIDGDSNEKVFIELSGSYGNSTWNVPTWHERLKPAYYELQSFLGTLNP